MTYNAIADGACPTPHQAAAALAGEMIDETAARQWFLQYMHPNGPRCPGCGSCDFSDRQVVSFENNLRVRCPVCDRMFTNRSGTIFEGSPISWQNLYLLLALSGSGWAPERVAPCVGVHADTVRRWVRRLEDRP